MSGGQVLGGPGGSGPGGVRSQGAGPGRGQIPGGSGPGGTGQVWGGHVWGGGSGPRGGCLTSYLCGVQAANELLCCELALYSLLPHGIMGNVAKHHGSKKKKLWDGDPPPRCELTNKVKLLPSRRTTYAGGNKGEYLLYCDLLKQH